jgi:hypothetical protein
MLVDNKYQIGDVVYLLNDLEQLPRMVTAITIRYGGYIEYELTYAAQSNNFIELEIVAEKIVV